MYQMSFLTIIISNLQSVFRSSYCTLHQLTDLHIFILETLDERKEVKVVFCISGKAFDRVWHKRVLCELHAKDIRRNIPLWFKSYLENRMQMVVINGFKSDNRSVLVGVPRGRF